MIIVLVPSTFLRLHSVRTGETLVHASSRLDGALVVYETRAGTSTISGSTATRCVSTGHFGSFGPVVSFGDESLRCHAKVLMNTGDLPEVPRRLLAARPVVTRHAHH